MLGIPSLFATPVNARGTRGGESRPNGHEKGARALPHTFCLLRKPSGTSFLRQKSPAVRGSSAAETTRTSTDHSVDMGRAGTAGHGGCCHGCCHRLTRSRGAWRLVTGLASGPHARRRSRTADRRGRDRQARRTRDHRRGGRAASAQRSRRGPQFDRSESVGPLAALDQDHRRRPSGHASDRAYARADGLVGGDRLERQRRRA